MPTALSKVCESEGERVSGAQGRAAVAALAGGMLSPGGGCGAGTASWLGQDQPGCCEASSTGSSHLVPCRSGNRTRTLHFKHGLNFQSRGADELTSSPA